MKNQRIRKQKHKKLLKWLRENNQLFEDYKGRSFDVETIAGLALFMFIAYLLDMKNSEILTRQVAIDELRDDLIKFDWQFRIRLKFPKLRDRIKEELNIGWERACETVWRL